MVLSITTGRLSIHHGAVELLGHGLSFLQCGLHLLGDPSPVHSHRPTHTKAEMSEVTKEGRTTVVVVGVDRVTSALQILPTTATAWVAPTVEVSSESSFPTNTNVFYMQLHTTDMQYYGTLVYT